MSAETVWNRICACRNDTSKEIERKYEYKLVSILAVLSTYPDREAYHGHESGAKYEPENAGTKTRLDAAISWLNARVPAPTPTDALPKRGIDPVKKGMNEAAESVLLAMIPEPGPRAKIFGLEKSLNDVDLTWRTKRSVKAKYNILARSLGKPEIK